MNMIGLGISILFIHTIDVSTSVSQGTIMYLMNTLGIGAIHT
jgi:hypothetical protein